MSEQHEGKAPQPTAHEGSRLFSVDALRGLIMVFMALDHANLLVAQRHSSGEYWGGRRPLMRPRYCPSETAGSA